MASSGDKIEALDYAVVIATRNRLDALELSLPLLLSQTSPPEQLIVIDSSDDHTPVAALVARLTDGWQGHLVVEHATPGLPYQRNLGLAHVSSPIVIFPDDDSLFYPETAAAILAIYARDREGVIAGVCAAEATKPPLGVDLSGQNWMTKGHKREARQRLGRNRLEKILSFLKPQLHLGRRLAARHALPDWLPEMNAVPVEYMTGFRMSFRTDAIRPTGFDEALGGYALDEDIDASFSALRVGLVVGARQARIYHHRFPSGRGNGARLGRMEVLNRLYVGLKHSSQDGLPNGVRASVRRQLVGFLAVKLLVALAGARSDFGRARLRGTWGAVLAAGPLWKAASADLAEAYSSAFVEAEGR